MLDGTKDTIDPPRFQSSVMAVEFLVENVSLG